jgi:hypothetical protein
MILRRGEELFKSVLDGIKPTWQNIFSKLREVLESNIFGFADSAESGTQVFSSSVA